MSFLIEQKDRSAGRLQRILELAYSKAFATGGGKRTDTKTDSN